MKEDTESCIKSKSKYKKNKRKATETPKDTDNHAKYRKLLYEKICNNWDNIVGIWKEKKEKQVQILRDNYCNMVRRLIVGEPVSFCNHTTSSRLSEVLYNLLELEREKKIIISGKMDTSNYEQQIKKLSEIISPENSPEINFTESIVSEVAMENEAVDRILAEVTEGPLPILDQQLLDAIIPSAADSPPPERFFQMKQNMTSPTSVLTEWAAENVLRANSNLEFRGAVSLISKKVVPSPAFVVPQYVNTICLKTDDENHKITGDKNNNSVNLHATGVYKSVKNAYTHGYKIKQTSSGSFCRTPVSDVAIIGVRGQTTHNLKRHTSAFQMPHRSLK